MENLQRSVEEIAYSSLKDQFRDRTVSKVYHALVQGHMDPTVGTIDAPNMVQPTTAFPETVLGKYLE